MTVEELITKLLEFQPYHKIMILDSFNGGGVPREINLGPTKYKITEHDAEEAADCEELKGETVVIMGYGSY